MSKNHTCLVVGETAITSLGKGRSGRESVIDFLARVIGMEKVSLPNFTYIAPVAGSSWVKISIGWPIRMSKLLMSKTKKSRLVLLLSSRTWVWWRIPQLFNSVRGATLRVFSIGASGSDPRWVSIKDFDIKLAPTSGLYNASCQLRQILH